MILSGNVLRLPGQRHRAEASPPVNARATARLGERQHPRRVEKS